MTHVRRNMYEMWNEAVNCQNVRMLVIFRYKAALICVPSQDPHPAELWRAKR
jgi:hypothetical protein